MFGKGMEFINKLAERFEGSTVQVVNENCKVSPKGTFKMDSGNKKFNVEFSGCKGKRIKVYNLKDDDLLVFLNEGVMVLRKVHGDDILKYIIVGA